jgi:hypothetical protein
MTGDRCIRSRNGAESTQIGARFHQENVSSCGFSALRRRHAGGRWLTKGRRGHRFAIVALLLALVAGSGAGCAERRRAIPPPEAAAPAAEPSPRVAAEPVHVPPLRPGQFRVCAFSFHSPDELAAIKSELSTEDFVFTDLSPVFPGGIDPAGSTLARKTPGWFMDRCRPDLRCDIVIYSGEFAGAFFGKYGYFVTVQEMEEASCQSRCQGLFSDPREVFLLGCNTLATKGADRRTPEEYRNVLLAHGYSHADAERVVAQRYGPLGASFRESLRRMFMGVPRLYGFSSVAPLGAATAPLLRDYFRRKGDYARYLTRAERDDAPNQELLAAFAGTGLVQTSGVTPLEPTGADRALVCRLYDDAETVSERLRIVQNLFARRDFLAFVPTVEVFLGRHPPEEYAGAERRLFGEIESLEAPRREVTALMYRLDVSVLKMQLANLARQLAWITPAEHDRLTAAGLKQLLAEPLSSEVADIGCELGKYADTGAALRSEDIPEQLLWHAEGYRLLDCLSPTDPRVTVRMLSGLENIDEATRVWAAYALWRRRPLDDEVLVAMAPRLNDPSAEVRDFVLRTFAGEAPLSPPVLAAIRERDPALAKTLGAQEEN